MRKVGKVLRDFLPLRIFHILAVIHYINKPVSYIYPLDMIWFGILSHY